MARILESINGMKVVIITKKNCPWCDKAKDLLKETDIAFFEMDISEHPSLLEVFKHLNLKTVPQIFNRDERIGGYNDLVQYFGSRGTF